MGIKVSNVAYEVMLITQIVIKLIGIAELFHDFIDKPWREASLLQANTKSSNLRINLQIYIPFSWTYTTQLAVNPH